MTILDHATSTLLFARRVISSFEPLVEVVDGAVGIRDGRIDWVGAAHAAQTANYDSILDLETATVIPGLVDAHVHLTFNAANDPIADSLSQSLPQQLGVVLANAELFLQSGVTTVRDLGSARGSVLTARAAIESGAVVGPTLIAADQPLTRPQGHLWALGLEVGNELEAGKAIEDLASRGADVCKIMVTGGRMTPGTDPDAVEVDISLLTSMVEFAHAAGLTVAAHCLSTGGIKAAAEGGVDTIEHGTFIDPGYLAHDERKTVEIAKRLAGAGIAVCPTLNTRHVNENPMSFEQRGRWVQLLHENGVSIIVGNDTGIPGLTPDLYAGGPEAIERAGLSRTAVLHAATAAPAIAMGRGSQVGTLDPGKRADLVALPGNPVDNLDHLSHPIAVIARGRAMNPAALSVVSR